jgi:aspartyl-tRNA(Asn)/glutamyl-tRNA(Gln) amidotransferase subunit C
MSLTIEQVEYIANLARLNLTEQEKSLYREQLSAILDFVAQLQALDTAEIPPTASVLSPFEVLRPDVHEPGLSLDALLRGAPRVEENQFRIPPVFD